MNKLKVVLLISILHLVSAQFGNEGTENLYIGETDSQQLVDHIFLLMTFFTIIR